VSEIDRLLDHHTERQIAARLNERGLTSGEGKPFHPAMVRRLRRHYNLKSRYQRPRDGGLLTLAEIAALLDVSTATIKQGASGKCVRVGAIVGWFHLIDTWVG
jgi:hypothetical protein